MKNYNTNQALHFYAAKRNRTGESTMANAGDIALKTVTPVSGGAAEAIYFAYTNGHGDATRTDTIAVDKVKSVSLKEAAGVPLKMYTITINSSVLDISNKKVNGTNGDAVGKTFVCKLHISQLFDYDDSNEVTCVASVVGDATNLASASAFYKALAAEIPAVLPKANPKYPLVKVFAVKNDDTLVEVKRGDKVDDISGTIKAIKLVQGIQKFSVGKLTGEPCPFDVFTSVNIDDVVTLDWATTVAADSTISGNIELPGAYNLANLEDFAIGERGDYYGAFLYPNDYDHSVEHMIDISKSYKVLSIEYYWAGNAETVQKSPRSILIAGEISGSGSTATCILDDLYNSVMVALGKAAAGSGSGA